VEGASSRSSICRPGRFRGVVSKKIRIDVRSGSGSPPNEWQEPCESISLAGWYHVISRGIERRRIFQTKRDYERLVELYNTGIMSLHESILRSSRTISSDDCHFCLSDLCGFCSNLRAGHHRKEPELPACGSISHHRILIGSACPSKNGNTEEIQQKDAKIAKTESTLGAEGKLGAATCKRRDLIGMNHLQQANPDSTDKRSARA
jgi:hypothetical protein